MKKSIKVRKISKKDLGRFLSVYLDTDKKIYGVVGGEVRHLELAVRSLNLQRTP